MPKTTKEKTPAKRGPGRPPKDPEKKKGDQFQLRLSTDLLARIDADAETRGVDSRSAWVRIACEYYLKHAP